MKTRFFLSILLGLSLILTAVGCTPEPETPDQPVRPDRPTPTERPPLPTKTPAVPQARPTKTEASLPSPTQPTQDQPAGANIIEGEAVAGINLEAAGGTYEYAFMTDYGRQFVAVGYRVAYVNDFEGIEAVFIPPIDEPAGNNTSVRTTDNMIVMAYVNQLAGEGNVRLLEVNPLSGDYERVADMDVPDLTVITLEFSPDGMILAVGYNNGEIRLYDTDDGSLILSIQAHVDNVTNLTFSYDGRYLASDSWSFDPFTYVFNVLTGIKVATLSTESYEPGVISFSPDGSLVSATSSDGTHIFTTGNWQATGVVIPGVWEGKFACDNEILMVPFGNATTDLYSVSTGQMIGTVETAPLYCYASELVSFEISPDGKNITVIAYNP